MRASQLAHMLTQQAVLRTRSRSVWPLHCAPLRRRDKNGRVTVVRAACRGFCRTAHRQAMVGAPRQPLCPLCSVQALTYRYTMLCVPSLLLSRAGCGIYLFHVLPVSCVRVDLASPVKLYHFRNPFLILLQCLFTFRTAHLSLTPLHGCAHSRHPNILGCSRHHARPVLLHFVSPTPTKPCPSERAEL